MQKQKNTKINAHGVLPIYKPKGVISKDVSPWILRTFGKVKLGHVGTLDPMAEGVLPVLLGKATRLQDYLLKILIRFTNLILNLVMRPHP